MARPDDLVDVPDSGYITNHSDQSQAPVVNNEGVQASARPNDLVDVDPDYVSKQINPYNTVTGLTTGAAVLAPSIEKKILGTDPHTGRSLETYLRTQRHHDYPGLDLKGLEKEWQTVSGPNARIVTMQDVQEALKETRPADLSAYKNAPQPTTATGKAIQPIKKVGEFVEQLNPFLGHGYGSRAFRGVGRAGLGFGSAYEGAQAINKGLEGDYSGAVGSASTGAGLGLMAVPHPVAKGAGAILAGVPFASSLMGNAQAAPMSQDEAGSTAFDLGTSLMGPAAMALSPSQLAPGTVQPKREVYHPGMRVLHGSTLPPEMRAQGGLVHLANGGEPNTAPFIGYPRITNKPRDPNFVQQSGPILGGLDAVLGIGKRDDVSMLTPEGQAYHESYDKYEPAGIAANVLPFMGGPTKAVGKAAMRELGPKAAGMAENYLTKIGGIQYAVPPSKSNDVIKASEALGKYEDKYLGLTQTDNMGIHGSRQGGNRFPTLQQTSPVHAEDKPVWAMDSEKHAERLIDSAQDPNLIFSTYIGRPDQLKSNKTVFNDVMQQHYNRNLTPEQIDLVNNRIATVKDAKGRLIFPQAFDIRDKFAAQELGGDTFARRGKMSDIIGLGEGVGKTRGGIALPQYEDILRSHRDPLTEGVPTSSIGTQLFKVDPNRPTFKTDKYHTDYQYPVFGENTGNTFSPFPHSMLDWHEAQLKKTNQVPHGNAWFNYMQTPQHINEKFLTRLQKEGFAPGGRVLSALGKSLGEAQAAYKAKFTPDFLHGSHSNKITAFDTQAERNPNFLTALEEESNDLAPRGFISLTKKPKFANDYATGKNATVYPVSANLGKHFDPRLPENYDVFHQYWKGNPESFPNYYGSAASLPKSFREAEWSVMEDPDFIQHLKSKGYNSMTMAENGQSNVGIFNPADIRGKFAKFNPEHAADPDFMKAAGGSVEGYAPGGKVLGSLANFIKHPHGQDARVAQALEEYLKGNISQEERIRVMNQFLPMRQWNELPPNYTDDQIRNALMSNKQEKALAPVPAGMRVGNRLDIPAYTQNGVYVDTTHALSGNKSPISYNRTGHLTDVDFSSKPDKAVRVGLGTQPQALTPMAAEHGADKSPFALIQGTNVGTKDDEVRRMMAEMMKDPNYTQIGMDPRKHSQFYDKSTGMPVWSAEEKLQSGPLIIAPKKGLETTSWDDPRLNLTDFPGKKYKKGGLV